MRKYKTSNAWYASPEHFRTEMSWEEYKQKNKPQNRGFFAKKLGTIKIKGGK